MSLYEGYYSTCAGLRLRVCAGKEGRGGEGKEDWRNMVTINCYCCNHCERGLRLRYFGHYNYFLVADSHRQ